MTQPRVDPTPASTRTNRSVLLFLGLLLTIAGGCGLAVSFGGFGVPAQQRGVLEPARSFAAMHDWFWLVMAAACLVIAVLALLWLRAQLATDRLHTIDVEADTSRGATSLAASAVERACSAELQSRRGIARADAVMLGTTYDQRLALHIALDGRESLRVIHAGVQSDVVPKIRSAVDNHVLPVAIEYTIARQIPRSPQ